MSLPKQSHHITSINFDDFIKCNGNTLLDAAQDLIQIHEELVIKYPQYSNFYISEFDESALYISAYKELDEEEIKTQLKKLALEEEEQRKLYELLKAKFEC